jgi:hypothetical protein
VWVDGLELERIGPFSLAFSYFQKQNAYRSLQEHLHAYVQCYVVGMLFGYVHLLYPTLYHRDMDQHEAYMSMYTAAAKFNRKVSFLMPLILSDA